SSPPSAAAKTSGAAEDFSLGYKRVVQHTDTILVVDDDSELSELMASILEDEGYQAVAVENGQVALDYLKKSPAPCVILLDLMMPSMNGWEFRDAQLSDPSLADILVVVVSATANIARAPITADLILNKPV